MKCIQCGHVMTTKRENAPYTALPGAVLVGVSVSRCPSCGEYEVAIPAIDELNRVLAQAVIRKRERLAGGELRFLRSYLGYSGTDFAKLIGSDPATVSRWESGKQQLGHHTDLLVRALVVLEKRVDEYPIDTFATVGAESTTGTRPSYAFRLAANKWKATQLAAA